MRSVCGGEQLADSRPCRRLPRVDAADRCMTSRLSRIERCPPRACTAAYALGVATTPLTFLRWHHGARDEVLAERDVAGARGRARRRGPTPDRRAPGAAGAGREPPGRGLPLHVLPDPPVALRRWHPGVGVVLAGAGPRAGLAALRRAGRAACRVDADASLLRPRRHGRVRPRAADRRPRPARAQPAASACTSGRWSTAPTSTGTRSRCGSARPAPTRSSRPTGSAAPTSTRTGSSPPTPRRATPCARRGSARSSWSSRGACTPGWTSTSGRRSSARSCPASCCSTRSRSPATSGRSTCARRPTTSPTYGYAPVRIETPEGKAEYVDAAARLRRARRTCCGQRLLAVLDPLGDPLSAPVG